MRHVRRLGATALAVPAALVLLAGGAAYGATTVDWTEIPLTQTELDASWGTDRTTPSGGYESVTFDGRSDVLEVRIDPDARSTSSSFYWTEGLKRDVPNVDAARIDLYVDPAWTSAVDVPDVRAGFWGVGEDASSSVTAYPIAEFTTAGEGGFTGWRVWNSVTGAWVNQHGIPARPGWTTVELVLDESGDEFVVSIGGHETTTPAGGSTSLGSVILNSYNYGPGSQPYAVHWSDFATGTLVELTTTDQCRDGGWADFGFPNQGQCVASLTANEASSQ